VWERERTHSFLFFSLSYSHSHLLDLPGWQGRAFEKHPVGVFSEEPACGVVVDALVSNTSSSNAVGVQFPLRVLKTERVWERERTHSSLFLKTHSHTHTFYCPDGREVYFFSLSEPAFNHSGTTVFRNSAFSEFSSFISSPIYFWAFSLELMSG